MATLKRQSLRIRRSAEVQPMVGGRSVGRSKTKLARTHNNLMDRIDALIGRPAGGDGRCL